MLTSKKEFGQNIGMSYHIVALINEDRKKKWISVADLPNMQNSTPTNLF